MFSTHELAEADLSSLASGRGGVRAVAALRAGYRSKLLVILRALLDWTPTGLGLLPPLGDSWDLLVEAQQVDPAAVDDVFGLPEVHGWAADTLRLVATTGDTGRLRSFVGQFHAVAAAAAIRAGIDFKATVPAVNGIVALPGLGVAALSSCDHAELTSISRRVFVRTPHETVQLPESLSEDGPGWLAQRRIRCVHADKVLDLWLDDIQPYRFGGVRPTARLTEAEAEGWRQRLDRAWRLLATNHPDVADELSVGLSTVVPRGAANRFRLASASTADAFGTMEIAPVEDAATMASVLIHEFSHSKLNGVLTLVDLDVEDREEKYYAPWRDDPRPLHGLLHGAYSFLAVTDFWQRERQGEPAWELEFAMRRGQVVPALQAIGASGLLTDAGKLFVAPIAGPTVRCPNRCSASRIGRSPTIGPRGACVTSVRRKARSVRRRSFAATAGRGLVTEVTRRCWRLR
jgi:HEXXH motif-containing protein